MMAIVCPTANRIVALSVDPVTVMDYSRSILWDGYRSLAEWYCRSMVESGYRSMLHTLSLAMKALPSSREEFMFSLLSRTWKSTRTSALPIFTSNFLMIPPETTVDRFSGMGIDRWLNGTVDRWLSLAIDRCFILCLVFSFKVAVACCYESCINSSGGRVWLVNSDWIIVDVMVYQC
ncbi:hypothetical protein F2Q69_00023282 [Brassica cretica]|uniref:Uncharacterized protein n=1 Tax=Brassica cretica TaxID=69181 RepID=A0A8S9Q8B7_BRACR|nr:hypothetical protein F2Q69_00023282 [Brassica cretica]